MNLTWGLFLVPWLRRDRRHLSLTLYPEDGSRDVEKLGDLRVSYRITLFNQGCGEDKVYRDTVDGVFARRLDRKLQSIQLVSLDIFLDPSYGFLVDETCAFGVEILDVARTRRRRLPASDTGPFRWTIQGLSKKPPFIFEKFGACGYDWIIFALVGRSHSLGSEGLHIYVGLSSSHILCQLFGRFRIRLINQLTGNHIDKSYCGLFHSGKFHGCAGVVPLRVFHDEEAGFLIRGCCVVEVEVTVLSKRPEQQVMNFYLGAGETGLTIQEENAYHNPFAWDMSPYWRILKKNPGFDITDLLLKHRYTSIDGHPLH
ncbi:uncharacterized protein LOC133890409 [Phragmites australis]|uniref:uncharacterized protein LOC133890409 n=1 Tax=Phragmites australis TaxID=29695 RepID=UPI002D76D0E8|nr:uncharacterized protein LOC133890409 [Phragmites australis]